MKSLLLLLAAVVAWTAASIPSGYRSGGMMSSREYVYDYESQILTGIPILNVQYSGLKIKARCMMQKTPDEYVSMKVIEAKVYKVKEDAEAWKEAKVNIHSSLDREERTIWEGGAASGAFTPTEWIPESLLEEIPSEHANIIVSELVKPIKFRYERGLITKVYCDGSDAYWSTNIKKGIIALLHLDMNAENQVSDVDISSRRSLMDVISPDYTTMSDKTGFKVKEPSPIGVCETFYSIVPDSSMTEIKVTKVPNTKKCTPKITAESGIFAGILSVPGIEPAKEMIVEPSIKTKYLLTGSRHAFVIKKALLTAKYSVMPASTSVSSIDGYIMQRLVFVKDEPIEREMTFETTPVLLRNGIMQYIPMTSAILNEINEQGAKGPHFDRKMQMIDELLTTMVQKSNQGAIDKEVPSMMLAITKVLRDMPKEELFELVETYMTRLTQNVNDAKKKEILIDMIPTIPHPRIIAVLQKAIESGCVSGIRAAMTINQACMTTIPSPTVVKDLIALSKCSAAQNQLPVRKSSIFGLGAVCNKMVKMHIKMGVETSVVTDVLKKAVKEMKSLLRSGDLEMREVAVKGMANLGDPTLISDLERIIKDKSEDKELRKLAIYATKKITAVLPKVIKNLLLPVYMCPAEPMEVRIAAFLMVMECRPSFSTYNVIASSLDGMKNPELGSFVYSYLQSLARATQPDLRKSKLLARKCLLAMRPCAFCKTPGMCSSFSRWDGYVAKMQAGVDMELNTIVKPRSALPSTIVNKIHLHIFGQAINIGEIGIHTDGLDEIIRRLIGTEGVLGDILRGRKDIKSILEPLSRADIGESIKTEIEEILSKIDLREVSNEDKVRLAAYARILGYDFGYLKMNKESIASAIDSAKTGLMELLPSLARGYEVDIVKAMSIPANSLVMATPVGLPLVLNDTMVAMVGMKGRITLEGAQGLLNGSPLKLKVDMHTTAAYKGLISLGIANDLFEVGTGLKGEIVADVPINTELNIDMSEKKVELKCGMTTSKTPKLYVEHIPMLYCGFMPMSASSYSASQYKQAIVSVKEVKCSFCESYPFDMSTHIPVVHTKLNMKGVTTMMAPGLNDPVNTFFTKQVWDFAMETTSRTPTKVAAEIRWGAASPAVRESESGWFSWWEDSREETGRATASSEFIPVTPKSSIENPMEKKIWCDIRCEGSSAKTVMNSQLVLVHNPTWTKQQINIQMVGPERSSMSGKVMVEAVCDIPNALRTLLAAEDESTQSSDFIGSLEVKMGSESFNEEKVKVEMVPYLAEQDPDIPWEKGLRSFQQLPVKSINVKMILEMSEKPKELVRMFYGYLAQSSIGLWKPMLPYYSYMAPPIGAVTSGNKAIICVQFLPIAGTVNVVAACPEATVYFMDWALPYCYKPRVDVVSPAIRRENVAALPSFSYFKKVPSSCADAFYKTCKVRNDMIETIDKLPLHVSGLDESCEIVLAHDCSPQRLYTVISSPSRQSGARKIKILVPGNKVEVGTELSRAGLTLRINGEPISVSASTNIQKIRTLRGGKIAKVLNITCDGERIIVKSPEVGLAVITDGRDVDVKISRTMLSRACGICAHVPEVHESLSSYSALIPTSKYASSYSARPIISKFLLSSSSCPASTEAPSYTPGQCSTRRRNVVLHRGGEICFSIRPIDICSDFCYPARNLPMDVSFHCMPAEDSFTKSLLKERHSRALSELANRTPHFQESVDIAQECIKA